MASTEKAAKKQKRTAECCRCNDKGKCSNCSRSKSSKGCFNCLPLRRGHCFNRFNSNSPLISRSLSPDQVAVTSTNQDAATAPDPSSDSVHLNDLSPSFVPESESQAPTLLNNSHSPPLSLPPCLPSFTPLSSSPIFSWGASDSSCLIPVINDAYSEIVTWKHNLFMVPFGKTGKTFISNMASLFFDYANNSSSESVSLKAALIMPALLLQRPHDTSTTKENVSCLDRRLQLWSEGSIADLLSEGKLIQSRLRRVSPNSGSHSDDHRATVFANLVMQGKISDAI